MPNHVINEVTIFVTDANADEVYAKVINGAGHVDFELLLPPPINFWPGGVSSLHEKAFPGTWLDWCSDNWSTKWNAYGQGDNGTVPCVRADGKIILTFQTAWGAPRGWLCAIFNTFKVRVEYRYLSEGGARGHEGFFDWQELEGGDWLMKPWAEADVSDSEQLRLHKMLWGVEKFDDEAAE